MSLIITLNNNASNATTGAYVGSHDLIPKHYIHTIHKI